MPGVFFSHSFRVGWHCANARIIVTIAKTTCATTIVYRYMFRRGSGWSSWQTRMAIAMLGKLKAPIKRNWSIHHLLIVAVYAPMLKAITPLVTAFKRFTQSTYGSPASGTWPFRTSAPRHTPPTQPQCDDQTLKILRNARKTMQQCLEVMI
jgi:hypothetical protein